MTNLTILIFVLLDIIGSFFIGMLVFSLIVWLIDKMIKSSAIEKENSNKKLNECIEKIENLKMGLRVANWQLTDKINKLKNETEKIIKIADKSKEDYDPIQVLNKLQSLLKNNHSNNTTKIWDLLYDKSEYPYKDIFTQFENSLNNIGKLTAPTFILKDEYNEFKNKLDYNITSLNSLYEDLQNELNQKIENLRGRYQKKNEKWQIEFQKFEKNINERNSFIDSLKESYYQKDGNAIEIVNKSLLEVISFDKNFQKDIKVKFNSENKVLIVEYLLPSIDNFPNIKEIRYLKTKREYKNFYYSQKELEAIYENVTYQIVLSLINRLFLFDEINQIDTIIFNGWTKSLNKATGLINEACILSVACNKKEFLIINLPEVDPKECFKALKGISAHKISNLTPIKPIISIDQNDKRFISSHNVEIDDSINLASMNWEDFEHLIREIFEKEFSSNGGNVKVTQSSRDGGVDAIAFDPDPIRGGKIVIQAKRYTNVVGVSAVRDLYGTVLNEGATKGILVTTSDYGSDSYNFAKDKPLTLLNGSNLLHLLENHNYKARINIKEAREDMKNI